VFISGKSQRHLAKAESLLNDCVRRIRRRSAKGGRQRISFLCGEAGVFALLAAVFTSQGSVQNAQKWAEKLSLMSKAALDPRRHPDELLYGRAGYLYSLLFVRSHCGQIVDEFLIKTVAEVILNQGKTLGRLTGSWPLMWEWHDKKYLGAAHGVAGILYILLLAKPWLPNDSIAQIVETAEKLLSLQWRSGNFPSSLGNERDKLVKLIQSEFSTRDSARV